MPPHTLLPLFLYFSVLREIASVSSNGSFPLDFTCSSARTDVYEGTCSPSFCADYADTTTPSCVFGSMTTPETLAEKNSELALRTCQSCTQSTLDRCKGTFLSSIFANAAAVSAAFCTDTRE